VRSASERCESTFEGCREDPGRYAGAIQSLERADREQDPTAAERMRRHRNGQRNNSVTQPITLRSPDSEAETERAPSQGRTHPIDEAPARATGARMPT